MDKKLVMNYIYNETKYGYEIPGEASVVKKNGEEDSAPEFIKNIQFAGFDGREKVSNLKQAVDMLEIENPVKTFAYRMMTGAYDDVEEEFVARDAAVANLLSYFWKYPKGYDPEVKQSNDDMQSHMNVMMVCANALTFIAQHAYLFEDEIPFRMQELLDEEEEEDVSKEDFTANPRYDDEE